MLARLLVAALVVGAAPARAQLQTPVHPALEGAALLAALDADYSPRAVLGYDRARDSLYAYQQRAAGAVCGVYTGFCITLTPGADPSTDAFRQGINAEHTWPQSMGAADEPARSDLHHLFPARDHVNSSRGNHPYAEIPDGEADAWYRDAASQSSAPTVSVDQWSEKDNAHPDPAFAGRFEPRHDHKGDAARAVFYVRAVYPEQVATYGADAFFEVQRRDLLAWHAADPVDLREYARTAWIAGLQGTPNPFVLDSTLARRTYRVAGDPAVSLPPPPGTASAGPLWVNELHYDNEGTDADEGVEIAGPAGASLDGWSLALYDGSGGVYQSVGLTGTLPDQQDGFGTWWVPVAGMQNGSPDGLALVDPAGAVAQFLSYEGPLAAVDGPAAGTAAAELRVSETASTPVGSSLQVSGAGATAADFAWAAPQPHTRGAVNPGQTFVVEAAPQVVGTGEAPAGPALDATVYPNPARDRATLALALAAAGDVRAEVYDLLGRRVLAVDAGPTAPGFRSVGLDVRALAPGVYVVRATAGGGAVATRLAVVR